MKSQGKLLAPKLEKRAVQGITALQERMPTAGIDMQPTPGADIELQTIIEELMESQCRLA